MACSSPITSASSGGAPNVYQGFPYKPCHDRLCWLMWQQPISNATRVGFTGERTWSFTRSNVICPTTSPCVFALTNRVTTSFTLVGTSADFTPSVVVTLHVAYSARKLPLIPRE